MTEDAALRTVAVEEHWGPADLLEAQRLLPYPARISAQLADVADARIAEMDEAGIDMQVLSLMAPGTEQLEPADAVAVARSTNDLLAEHVRRNPARFAALAAVPTPDPEGAVEEVERALDELGMAGAIVNGHARGRYLDDEAYQPLLAALAARRAPVYLHPTPSPAAVQDAWYSGLPEASGKLLAAPGWGWHVETATHLLRLVVGGVFDRNPELQIVVGHLGEGVPFMFPRFDRVMSQEVTGLRKPISAYLRENVSYTFGGFNWTHTFELVKAYVGAERLMFSTDYPFGSMRTARDFLDGLDVTTAEREAIAHGNAERTFRL